MGMLKLVGKTGFYLFADALKDRFVAGETPQDAVRVAEALAQRGEKAVINILGEHVTDRGKAARFCNQIIELITMLAVRGLFDVHIAEKPSQIGLDISEDLYVSNKVRILRTAQYCLPDALIETDAEDHSYRESVFRITLELSKSFSNQLLAVQLNRQDALQEIKILNALGIPFRLCKGDAYPGEIKKAELRRIFLELAPLAIEQGNRPAFATQDLLIIDSIAKKFPQYKDKFEFDLLMGIEKNLCRESHLQGFTFRRYIPCGPNWRPYGKRRGELIAEIMWRNWRYRIKKC